MACVECITCSRHRADRTLVQYPGRANEKVCLRTEPVVAGFFVFVSFSPKGVRAERSTNLDWGVTPESLTIIRGKGILLAVVSVLLKRLRVMTSCAFDALAPGSPKFPPSGVMMAYCASIPVVVPLPHLQESNDDDPTPTNSPEKVNDRLDAVAQAGVWR